MSVRKFGEWIARSLAVAALFVAFKPGDALAAPMSDNFDSVKTTSDDTTSMVTVDIDVDGEIDPPSKPE